MLRIALTLTILIFDLTLAEATTYYIRPHGGTRTECTGTTDADYPGSGTARHCGFNNPIWALGSVSSRSLPSLMNSGDTLLIHSGSYKIGYDPQFTGFCGIASAFDCRPMPLPSGAAQIHTKILGETYNTGCAKPPELWGSEKTAAILNLSGSSNIDISCLEITDHSGCRQGGPLPNRCYDGAFPKGDWASVGIIAVDAQKVNLTDINIHGMAAYGLWTARLSDWEMIRVKINGQGQAGWHGEYDQGNSSNSGALHMKNSQVMWNGCGENYPGKISPVVGACCSQSQGCYNDGIGMADSGGNYIIEDSNVSFNAEDGIDLLHVTLNPPTSVIIRRNRIEGNAGNGIKTGATNVKVENNILISGCSYLENAGYAAPGWVMGDNSCRGGGELIGMDVGTGTQHKVYNNTIIQTIPTRNVTISSKVQGAICNGAEKIIWSSNVAMGGNYLQYNDVQNCFNWSNANFENDHNLVFDVASGCPSGAGNLCLNPLLVNATDGSYFPGMNVSQKFNSPTINLGNTLLAFSDNSNDYAHTPRGTLWDAGAMEFTGTPSPLIIDNSDPQCTFVGVWPVSTAIAGYLGANYQSHAAGTGLNATKWTFKIPATWQYEVRARWTSSSNRASNAPYTIIHANGAIIVPVNQQLLGGQWISLGIYTFNAGNAVVILSDKANGKVIADAVKLRPLL